MRRRLVTVVLAALVTAGVTMGMPAASAAAAPSISKVSPSSGRTAGGTRVTVFGSNFSHVRAVKFGARAGTSIRVLSSGKLLVTAPAGSAGTVDVRVVAAAATSAVVRADRFTYVRPPAVTGISPHAGTTAGGTRVTITGSNFVHVSRVSFGATAGTKIHLVSSTKLVVTAPTRAAGVVAVRVTTAYGTSAAVAADHYTYVIPLAGTVTAGDASGPLANVAVLAFSTSGPVARFAQTGADGKYTIPDLTPGDYVVCFDATDATGGSSTTGYVTNCYDNKSLAEQPTTVTVTSGLTRTINAALPAGGAISGHITTSDAAAVSDVDVVVFDTAGHAVAETFTATGSYTLKGVPAGSGYTVCFDTSGITGGAAHGYTPQCWNGITWSGGNPVTGVADLPPGTTPVSATVGTETPNINAVLAAKP